MIQDSDANFRSKLTPVLKATPTFVVIDSCYKLTHPLSRVTCLMLQRLSSSPPLATCWAPSVTPPRRPRLRYQAQVTRWGVSYVYESYNFISSRSSWGSLRTRAQQIPGSWSLGRRSRDVGDSWPKWVLSVLVPGLSKIKYWMITAELRSSCFTT